VKGSSPVIISASKRPGHGTQSETMMGVAEGEPEPVVTLGFADHWDHVGETGPPAHPRFWLQPFGERK